MSSIDPLLRNDATPERSADLDRLDHVALTVTDISKSIEWYQSRFHCEVLYQDASWAFLQFQNVRIAFVLSDQHPPHLGFVSASAASAGELSTHRDGTRSIYLRDPSDNVIELLAEENA